MSCIAVVFLKLVGDTQELHSLVLNRKSVLRMSVFPDPQRNKLWLIRGKCSCRSSLFSKAISLQRTLLLCLKNRTAKSIGNKPLHVEVRMGNHSICPNQAACSEMGKALGKNSTLLLASKCCWDFCRLRKSAKDNWQCGKS